MCHTKVFLPRDVLRASGMDVDSISLRSKPAPSKALHIGLLGSDMDEVGNQYCCSFPFDKAIDPYGDVILAYEMNGEPIPRRYSTLQNCIAMDCSATVSRCAPLFRATPGRVTASSSRESPSQTTPARWT